jgi:hypothetical protein
MSVSLEKLSSEPIVIVTIVGLVNVEGMRDIYLQIAEILEAIDPPLYRITDVREQETSFAEMIEIVKEAGKGLPGTTTDPRIRNSFVGRHKFAMLARDFYRNSDPNRNSMPVFDTLEEALFSVRSEIKQRAALAAEGRDNRMNQP